MIQISKFRSVLALAVMGTALVGCSDGNRTDLSENSTVETQNSDVATISPNEDAAIDRQAATDAPLGTKQPAAPNAEVGLAEDSQVEAQTEQQSDVGYDTVSFSTESVSLSDDATRTLDDLTQSLDKNQPVAVTVRTLLPGDSGDIAQDSGVTQQRVDNVKQYLEDKGFDISQWKVDDAAAAGGMSAPEESEAQQIFITIMSEPATEGLSTL